MNHTITTTLSSSVYYFLIHESKQRKVTKKSILEEALELYKKNKLKQEIEEGLKERYQEYQKLNEEMIDAQLNSIIE